MLHEFHQQSKSDGKACHATYILAGLIEETIPPPTGGDATHIDSGDCPMSSPPPATQESSKSTTSGTRQFRTITLADENDVHGIPSFDLG